MSVSEPFRLRGGCNRTIVGLKEEAVVVESYYGGCNRTIVGLKAD